MPCRDENNCGYTPIFAWPVRAGQTDGNPDPTYPANLPKTGQTASFGTRDDGAIEAGVAWPNPRFTVTYCNAVGPCPDPSVDCDADPLNDVVTDNLTGLIWVRVPDNIHRTWIEALGYSNGFNICGYTNWRLPNINELGSMVHNGEPDTAVWLNTAPPYYFIGVESFFHWSSTTHRSERNTAMIVDLWDGSIENHPKGEYYYAWPVRFSGYQLSVRKEGIGSGVVTSAPPGINCGTDCKEIFEENTAVTLTAQADSGFIFKGWYGVCGGTGTCSVTMNADTIVTAVFEGCKYTVSPTSGSFPAAGGTIKVGVIASGLDSCPTPSVSSQSSWIVAKLTSFQNNKGIVDITIAPSNSSYRRRAAP